MATTTRTGSTSAICGDYNYATGVTTYAYGIFSEYQDRDVFVGRTRDENVVRAYFAQYLTPGQVEEAFVDGLTIDGWQYWCNMGH